MLIFGSVIVGFELATNKTWQTIVFGGLLALAGGLSILMDWYKED